MVTTRRRSSAESSRPETAVVQASAGKKRSITGQEPANKRQRSSGDEDASAAEATETLKQKKPRNRKSRAKDAVGDSKAPKDTQTSKSQPRHVRFGSEDAELPQLAIPEAPQDIIPEEEEDDSDDEAPEDVAAADAQATSAAAQRQAARAVEQQQAKARKKRRERETQLQEQAKTSTKPKRSKPVDLPDLLPEDILTDDPFDRPPTPSPEVSHPKLSNDLSTRKVFKFEDTRPKDIQVGPVRVSVLQKQNKLLPPRASGSSKSIREQWLAGRKGSSVQRQSVGGGFVRR